MRSSAGNTLSKYFMSRMLSTASRVGQRQRSTSVPSSCRKRCGDLLRNPIEWPFSPQNVQWDFAPHQQPRELSNSSTGATCCAAELLLLAAKYVEKSGIGRLSIGSTGRAGGVPTV